MTRLILISALCGSLALRGHSQSITTWIEQLSALQTLQQTIRQGYQTVTTGLQTIGDTRYEEYQLHNGYFGSLDRVKPSIVDDPRLQALRGRLAGLIQQLHAALDYWQRQPSLSQ